jgi:hypothetical protein
MKTGKEGHYEDKISPDKKVNKDMENENAKKEKAISHRKKKQRENSNKRVREE